MRRNAFSVLLLSLLTASLMAASDPARAQAPAAAENEMARPPAGGPVRDAAVPPENAARPGRLSPAEIAAAAYARGDWETAIAQYRAMLAEGYVDPALYFNLGTTYARADQKGRAVWMLLKARQLDPRDASIRKNLELVAPDLSTQIAFFPLPPVEAIYRSLRMNEWAWIGGGGMALAGLAFGLFFWVQPIDRRRFWFRRLAVLGALIALTGHGFAAAKYYDQEVIARGVVIDPETRPHAAPSPESEVYTFTLPPGTLVQIQNAGVEGWIKAIYGGRNEVFIRDDQYERL